MKADKPAVVASTGRDTDSGAPIFPLRGGEGRSEGGRFSASVAQPSTVNSQTPPPVPDHELLRRIGLGSYGEVWLARNKLGTLRAVKIVYRHRFEDQRPFEREFKGIQKFEPISRLHEGLVDILQVGGTEEYFYYVMELADDGQDSGVRNQKSWKADPPRSEADSRPLSSDSYFPRTLRSDLEQHGCLPVPQCVEIGLALSSALAHLHAQGLVHRDVKPSNIIFVHGMAKLADIGLVAEASEARSFVGTEGFIPPEGPGTPQADLYSLGKLLYEISTGQDRRDFPALPAHSGKIAVDDALLELNAVILKACHRDPRQRYQTAQEMYDDLALLRAGKSVKQRHNAARGWRFAKRSGAVAAIGAVIITGLIQFRPSHPQPLDPLTTGKNVGGYPPTTMRGTTNKEAWDHYRLGYSAFRRLTAEGNQQAEQHYKQAIERDPRFALGYFGLWVLKFADTLLLTHAKTDEWRRLADKLVETDNGLAEAHVVLGFIRFWEWKWPEAEVEYREALRLNPHCIPAWVALGFQLSHVGRTDEALQVLDRGLQVDPNAPQLVKMKGHTYFVRRQFQRALDLYLESTRREPLFTQARLWTARAYFAMTNYPAAIDELERFDLLRGERASDEAKQEYAELRRAFHEGGVRGFWLKQLDLKRGRWKPDEYPYTFAQVYAWLGDKEQALTFLEKAFERHDELVYLIYDECWDPWRDEPRFEAIRKKIGMPRHPNFPAK